jgi:hypothetical protein
MEVCDATICIEKSNASSGTQLPISISLSPNIKHVFIESISVILTEKRVYRLPEFQARRVELHDFKVPISSASCMADPTLTSTHGLISQLSMKEMRRALGVKNAHIPLYDGPFQHRLIFQIPNCVHLNHSSTFSEIDIRHMLKIHIELTSPVSSDPVDMDVARTHVRLETPITILDCRLKEDYNALPTYEESLLVNPILDDQDLSESKPAGFFLCPCYLEYKKKRKCGRQDWIKIRNEQSRPNTITHTNSDEAKPPPSYDSLDYKY